MSQKLKQYIYVTFISFIAIAFFTVSYIFGNTNNWEYLLLWCLLAIVAETFTINSPSGVSTSVGPAIYIYIALESNPIVTLIVVIIGYLFCFPEEEGVRKSILNNKKITTFFNSADYILTVGASSWVIYIIRNNMDFQNIVLSVALGLIVSEVMNFIVLAPMVKITQNINPLLIFRSMLKTFPSSIAIGSLGIFLSFLHVEAGIGYVLLFFVPLLLARYSFKLYFESQRMALDTIHALNEALHAKDAYTGGHTGRVEQYAVDLAGAYGLPLADCELIRTAALLHDIGKIGIPDDILNKPGRLTREEFDLIQEHSSIGAKILGNVKSLKRVSQIIVQHHERYDGSGYPNKLKGDEISIEASILMVSDSYDAMTTDRPYRKALSNEQAISELKKYSGTQFHPMLAKCFIEGVLNKLDTENLVESTISDSELLEKTKEVVNAGSDLPQDIMEQEALAMKAEAEAKKAVKLEKEAQEEDRTSRYHPMRMMKETH